MSVVSIIVPVYGVEEYIEKCARSLFEQTYDDIDYVFVNDCTPDNSLLILKRVMQDYPHRMKQVMIVNHEVNRGLAAARKTGLQYCTGEYVLHVDSDDWIENNTIELLYRKAVAENADVVVYDLKHVYNNSIIEECNEIGETKEEYISMLLERRTSINLVTKLFRTDICKNEDVLPIEGLNYSEDYATLPRIIYHAHKVVKLDAFLYNYSHLNENSYTNTINRRCLDSLKETLSVLRNFFLTKEDGILYTDSIQKMTAINYNIMLLACSEDDLNYIMRDRVQLNISNLCSMPLKHIVLYLLFKCKCKAGILWCRSIKQRIQ